MRHRTTPSSCMQLASGLCTSETFERAERRLDTVRDTQSAHPCLPKFGRHMVTTLRFGSSGSRRSGSKLPIPSMGLPRVAASSHALSWICGGSCPKGMLIPLQPSFVLPNRLSQSCSSDERDLLTTGSWECINTDEENLIRLTHVKKKMNENFQSSRYSHNTGKKVASNSKLSWIYNGFPTPSWDTWTLS